MQKMCYYLQAWHLLQFANILQAVNQKEVVLFAAKSTENQLWSL